MSLFRVQQALIFVDGFYNASSFNWVKYVTSFTIIYKYIFKLERNKRSTTTIFRTTRISQVKHVVMLSIFQYSALPVHNRFISNTDTFIGQNNFWCTHKEYVI